jgi:kynureninase
MVDEDVRRVAQLQAELYREAREHDPPELAWLVERAIHPEDVRRAVLKEQPVLSARRSYPSDAVHLLRDELAAVDLVDGGPADLAFRRLYPALDVGVYCASHAMGKPSVALLPAVEEHLGQLRMWGFQAWNEGWIDVLERFRVRVAELVGGDLLRGDVLRYPNVSEALSALLNGGMRGRMVTSEDHFTSAAYVHEAWAARSGSELVTVAEDPTGASPLDGLIEALTPETEVVSVATASWRTGTLLDIYALSEAIMDVCPDAALLVDAYQTLGTVPLSIGRLPLRTAVLGGAIKQLRGGPGACFAWGSWPLLEEIEPDRTGWWGHAEPLAFAPPPLVPARGAARFGTGVPDPTPIVALLTEIDVFATSGQGSLAAAIRRAREVTSSQVARGLALCESLGLEVAGAGNAEERGAFFAVRVPSEAIVSSLAGEGVLTDFRPDVPGGDEGLCRISANAASHWYELEYAVTRLAALLQGDDSPAAP